MHNNEETALQSSYRTTLLFKLIITIRLLLLLYIRGHLISGSYISLRANRMVSCKSLGRYH